MKVLLDENIMPKSKMVLEKYGHDVIHVLDRDYAGKSDEDVFQLSIREKRVLLTLNGRDFIVLIPPIHDLKEYYGLIWLRGFQITNKTYEKVMDIIGKFLVENSDLMKNTYYAMKREGEYYKIVQRYPRDSMKIFKY